jgi:hypothetical protein
VVAKHGLLQDGLVVRADTFDLKLPLKLLVYLNKPLWVSTESLSFPVDVLYEEVNSLRPVPSVPPPRRVIT